jgi:hypothetical protein
MSNAKSHSASLKQEADKLLESTKLNSLLEQFGIVDLGGSYAYDLMVDRDLDFGVAVEAITPEVRAEIAQLFASQSWMYGMNMTDRANFKPLSHLKAPRALYLGLTIPFPEERWNVDIWFTIGDELPEDELTQMISKATQEQKDIILEIKYDLLQSGRKEKGITSAEVYKAVMLNKVTSTEQFLGLGPAA